MHTVVYASLQEVWTRILHQRATNTGNLKRVPMKVVVLGMTCQPPPTLICLLPGPAASFIQEQGH